ncbi:MAG: hypothetical protein IV107_05665 [Paucibacter sp.]|nr:hypothetical protein [Roseateles sp.]
MSLIDPFHTIHATSIRERAKSSDYAAQALEAIVRLHQATDPPALLDRLMNATVAIGATASVYTVAIPEDGPEPSCFSLFACHPGFAQEQGDHEPLLNHPWFRFARTHTTPGTDHQITPKHDADFAALSLARKYGFKSCLIVPTPAGADLDRLEMLCLGSDREDDFEGSEARVVRTLARSLAAELHDWLTRYLRQRLQAAARLQEKDVDLLAMEWQGLGSKEISLRTGLSVTSVDSRFQRINARLNCASRKASAKRAAAYGLLESA